MPSTTKRSKTTGIPSQPYEEIDFAAAGMVATQEESIRHVRFFLGQGEELGDGKILIPQSLHWFTAWSGQKFEQIF